MNDENSDPIDLVVMLGEVGDSFPEQLIGQVREAIALDTVEKGLSLRQVRQVIVSTNRPSFIEKVQGLPVTLIADSPGVPFHFGRQLRQIVQSCRLDRVFYIGGGAAPLLSSEQLGDMLHALGASPKRLVTNNLYSSDMVGFSAELLDRIDLPDRDNDLAWELAQLGGLDVRQPPRSAGTAFDIDTITDAMILKICPVLSPHVSATMKGLDLDTSRLEAALQHLQREGSSLLLIGRSSSDVWTILNQRCRCAIRMIVEERGMRASGRLARGEVRSLVGYYMQEHGFASYFALAAQSHHALLVDSRVLFAHLGPWPNDADRSYSDLSMPEKIQDKNIQALTEAAMLAPIPVVLGGHSLVSGGILALIDAMSNSEKMDQPFSSPAI